MSRAAWKSPSGLWLAAAVALSGVAFAEPAATAPATAAPEATAVASATEATATEAETPGLSGMIVAIDKDGKLRQPTREEALALLAQRMPELSRMAATREVAAPGGFRAMVLGPEHLNFSMVTLSPSGVLGEVCTNDPLLVLQTLDGVQTVEK